MPDAGKKPIISFRIRDDIKDGLQQLANDDRRSLSSYIEIVLDDHLKAKRGKKQRRSGSIPA
jgi:hypothetical protein